MDLWSKVKSKVNHFTKSETPIETETGKTNKEINDVFQELYISNGTMIGGGEWIIDNIFKRLSNELSLLQFKDMIRREKEVLYLNKSRVNEIFNLRANELQTSADFLASFFYQMLKYGNGLAMPGYDNQGNVVSLEMIDVTLYDFGVGYDEIGKYKYLLMTKKPDYKNKPNNNINFTSNRQENKTMEIISVRYDKLIHVRRDPVKVLNGDKYQMDNDIGNLPTLFNKNIQEQLTEMTNNNTIKGVLTLNGVMGDEQTKTERAKAFVKMLNSNKSGVMILDDTESFINLNKTFKTVSPDDIDKMFKYLYSFYGINENILNGTFSYEEYSAFYNATLEPIIKRFQLEVIYKLFTKKEREYGRTINVIKRSLIGVNLSQLTNYVDKMVYHGVLNRNEVRDEMGYELVPGGDIYYTNANAVEVGKTQIDTTTSTEVAKKMYKAIKDEDIKAMLSPYIE